MLLLKKRRFMVVAIPLLIIGGLICYNLFHFSGTDVLREVPLILPGTARIEILSKRTFVIHTWLFKIGYSNQSDLETFWRQNRIQPITNLSSADLNLSYDSRVFQSGWKTNRDRVFSKSGYLESRIYEIIIRRPEIEDSVECLVYTP